MTPDTALEAFGQDATTLVIDTGGQVAVRSENYKLYKIGRAHV